MTLVPNEPCVRKLIRVKSGAHINAARRPALGGTKRVARTSLDRCDPLSSLPAVATAPPAWDQCTGPLNEARMKAVASVVRVKVRKLCRQRGFKYLEHEDIEQQIWEHLTVRAKQYDPAKSTWKTFVSFILDRLSVSMIRKRLAMKRSPLREAYSLDELLVNSNGCCVDRRQLVPDREGSSQPRQDLMNDVAKVREQLPTEMHRRLLDELMRGGSRTSFAEESKLGIRAAKRLVADVKQAMEAAGMFAYVTRVQRQGAAA